VADVQKPREIAARILQQRLRGADYTETLLDHELAAHRLSPADRGLCQELVYGIVRQQAALNWLITRKTGGRPQKPALQILLQLGLYQIFWLDRIPDHAAVNETVEMAKRAGYNTQAGFINAVLRGYLRQVDETKKLLTDLKTAEPALGYSHPEWLVTRWRKNFGAENLSRLLELNNTPPKTFARVNTLKTDAGKLLENWREQNVEYDFVRRDWLPENLIFELKAHPPLPSLPSFQQGWFYLQDPSTLLAGRELDPQPGETILDLCAAPGGKTTFIAQLMNNTGKLVAHDIAADRVKLVRENCTRLGVTCVEAVSAFDFRPSTFDRVLVDAPCSNTGVLRRRVDLRWRVQPDEITRLRANQLDLLKQAASTVKPGGVLVYSTCSLEPEENSEVAKGFLAAHPDFKLESARELMPFADGADGAYVAKFRRVTSP
jgi:16S rRNA (cytosine967-C5)-methyltransferase